MKTLTFCKKSIFYVFLTAGFLVFSAFFNFAFGAEADLPPGITQEQIDAALKELSTTIGQDITTKDQAEEICNQEKFFDVCADIGKKHNLYKPDEVKQVDEFLVEFKGKIVEDLKSCTDEECLLNVATQLAKKIASKNSKLAIQLDLTVAKVEEKKSIAVAAREAGISFNDCHEMDPDTASIELLRACAKLAKDSRVQRYIPEVARESVLAVSDQMDKTAGLKEALASGKFSCGDGTLEGCGNFCLNPSATTRVQGTSGIPLVCNQIAREFFGPEGVKQLESSYNQISDVKDFYATKSILKTSDGKEIIGKDAIRNTCDQAFSSGNVDLARSCGDFAVRNGFATKEEVDKGLKFIESFSQKATNVNFNECVNNPKACEQFIPDDFKQEFEIGNQIKEIMIAEIGFDPRECERGQFDESIGTRCFEGSKRALSKLEGLANQSQQARFIIEDIKRHVSRGDDLASRKDEFREVFEQQGGPGGCKSEQECRTYCSDPNHGAECIAFGAKQEISGFKGNQAIERFQQFNNTIQGPQYFSPQGFGQPGGFQGFPGQGPYQGFQPPGQGGFPPGQIPGFSQSGQGFDQGFPGPVGPSPQCFEAIQRGDFIKAKELCSGPNLSNFVPPPSFTPPICPLYPFIECPAGYYRRESRDQSGCFAYGECVPSGGTYQPPPTQCPEGQYWDYRSNVCTSGGYDPVRACNERGGTWTGNTCQFGTYSPYPTGPYPTYNFTPIVTSNWSGHTWRFIDGSEYSSILNRTDSEYTSYIAGIDAQCSQISKSKFFWKSGAGNDSPDNWRNFGIPDCSGTGIPPTYSTYPTYSYSPYPTTSGGIYSCFYPNATKNGRPLGYTVWCEKDYFNCHEGSKTGPSIGLDGLSLGGPSSCESGYQGQSCNNNQFCDSNETYTSCPSDCGGATYSPPPNCPSGQWWDYATNSCKSITTTYSPYPSGSYTPYPSPTGGSCPSGAHSMGSYCMSDNDSTKCGPLNSTSTSGFTSCSTYQTNGGSCPSGAHSMGSYCMSDASPVTCGPLNSSSTSSFGSCSSYQTTSTSYTPPPTYTSPSCPAGQWWDPATNSCKSNTTTYSPYPSGSYTPYPSPTGGSCPSGAHSMGSYCMSDNDSTKCGPLNSTSTSSFGSCSSYQTSYTPYPSSTYSSPPSCPAGQWWDYVTLSCKSTTFPTPSTFYSSPPSGTSYTPYPTCPSGQWWDTATSSCKTSYTLPQYSATPYPTYVPPPTTEYVPPPTTQYTPPPAVSSPPPPTSMMIMHRLAYAKTVMKCTDSGGKWDTASSSCRSAEAPSLFANVIKIFKKFIFK